MVAIKLDLASPALSRKHVEKVGASFLLLSNKNNIKPIENLKTSENQLPSEDFFVNLNYLKSLDPKDWKNQDHYAVLGLGHSRFHASEEDIKRAYRKIVLQHHPDKRKAKGEDVKADDDYFICITKAYEILGTLKSRRSYDSVDPQFNDDLPSQLEIDSDLYPTFNKYFDLNARWSEKKNVPSFGDANAERSKVDQFYNFWYSFDSWREFSYLDEEDKEKGQDRDERRWIEKQNKAARVKRKKEEMVRIRALVDLAYTHDKRISKFKNEEKERKLALKRAKMNAVQAQKEENERLIKEAQLVKEQADKAEQKRIEKVRTEKEQQKKALKKERKRFRETVKEHKYFASNDKDVLKNMEGVEKICEELTLSELQTFNKKLEKLGKDFFYKSLQDIDQKLQNNYQKIASLSQTVPAESKDTKVSNWNTQNVQLLIKAVNLFPAGTIQRWEVIATFMNQHANSEITFTAKDVLNKAKSLQNDDSSISSLKRSADKNFFANLQVNIDNQNFAEPCETSFDSQREFKEIPSIEAKQENSIDTNDCDNNGLKKITPSKIWTKEEQAFLEQAIKSYPISTPDRWDRIAECVPNKSKKDCLRRVKELVELVNSKRNAQQMFK